MQVIIYETERLIVRQWTLDDANDLFEYASDEEVTKFLHYKRYENIEDAELRISNLIDSYNLNPLVNCFAIELKSNKKVIGDINFSSYKAQAEGSVRIGYTINKNFQGNGYATEMVKGALKFIKQKGIAKRIEATHDVENVKSGNVLKKVGMTFEGILRKAGENNFHNRYDVALYSILDEEIDLEENLDNSNNKVTIYTDGACSGNPGAGGWGAVLFYKNTRREISGYEENTTNNKMELTAAIKALEMLKKPCKIELYSDSAYLINAFNEGWITNWQLNGFKNANKKPVQNVELWQQLIEFNNMHKITWIKVKGHADNEHNNRCDQLATGEIAKHQ